MAKLNRYSFLAVAVAFHLIYIYSIFDIYFVSPIVSGMDVFGVERPPGTEAPARRLVLFVGDGLRADKAFQSFPDPSPLVPADPAALEPRPLAPFLRSRVLEHGTFGVSHTRVPTESRPGHVALIAGLYEDVSAVTTGWKLNPVNFDSVFNQSRHTWSWGSPDILPMFKEGAVPGRVDADSYSEDFEDFTQDATQLDTWVFDKVQDLFRSATTNSTLNALLRQDKLVFFLHLLGLDTTGHAYRPYSKEYYHNIKVVDAGVERISALISDFYTDGKTAFVFTADHGMSDWGSHGDGHPDNTRTPLIAWGSGVAKPLFAAKGVEKAPGHEDGFSHDWGMDKVQRNDVAQADIAALMAYLAGIDFPANSVGELPLAYLAGDVREKAEAALVNARGVLEMYRVKDEQKRAKVIRYKPFPPLGDEAHSIEHRIAEIRALIDSGNLEESIKLSVELLQIGLAGMRYLQTYDWLFLRTLVTIGYLGWIAFSFTTVIDQHVLHGQSETLRTPQSIALFSSVMVILFAYLWVQQSPWTYYAYALFPVGFWEEVFSRRSALLEGRNSLMSHVRSPRDYTMAGLKILACVGLLEAMVQGYYNREVLSVCYFLGASWPAFYGKGFLNQNPVLALTWLFSCITMSTFTLLPVVKVEDINLILIGGLLMFAVGILFLMYEKVLVSPSTTAAQAPTSPLTIDLSRIVIGVQLGLILLAMIVTRSSVASLQGKDGLPAGNQAVGWLVVVASVMVPFLHALQPRKNDLHRLVVFALAFSPIFIILTISYEGLFYFVFCLMLVTWVRMEHRVYQWTISNSALPTPNMAKARLSTHSRMANSEPASLSTPQPQQFRALILTDFRTSLFFLFLLQSAFFSTGNVASLAAFSLDSVYRLIPVFNPFSQGALLLLKLMIPFTLISANLAILNRRLGVAPSALFMGVMAMADVLTLNFFWMVRDEGSWLEIGESISHFCIASLLGIFVTVLEGVGELVTSGVEVESEEDGDGLIAQTIDAIAPLEISNGKAKMK